jgi:hypothetical protein
MSTSLHHPGDGRGLAQVGVHELRAPSRRHDRLGHRRARGANVHQHHRRPQPRHRPGGFGANAAGGAGDHHGLPVKGVGSKAKAGEEVHVAGRGEG